MSYKSGVPKTSKDAALSRRHLKDTIEFNMNHAKDHLKEAKDAKKALKDRIKDLKKGY
jgi:hypothetical protein